MSTILDALRKIEEDAQARNANVRARLLSTPQRFDLRPPRRQRFSWLISIGLMVSGIAVGASVMWWGRSPRSAVPTEMAPTPAPVSRVPSPPPDRPLTATASIPEQKPPTSDLATSSVPPAASQEPSQVMLVSPSAAVQVQTHNEMLAAQSPDPSAERIVPRQQTRTVLPALAPPDFGGVESENPVQRSPFVHHTEPERLLPSPAQSVERRVTAKAKPLSKPAPPPQARTGREAALAPVKPPPSFGEEGGESEAVPLAPPASVEEEVDVAETAPPASTPVSVSFLQWSSEPERRMASIKVGDGPTTLAHEGDTILGVTVVKIRQGAVELRSGSHRWTLKTH